MSIGRGLPSGSGMLINEYKTAYLTVQEGEDFGFYLSQETFYLGWPFLPNSWNAKEQLQFAYETRDDDISGLYTRWFPNQQDYRGTFNTTKIIEEERGAAYWVEMPNNYF